MIWLLISQGFARHINANQEAMRDYIVDFSGKQSLIVKTDKQLEDPTLSWSEIFPQFTEQIKKQVGNSLVETLTCNFSTTTPGCPKSKDPAYILTPALRWKAKRRWHR